MCSASSLSTILVWIKIKFQKIPPQQQKGRKNQSEATKSFLIELLQQHNEDNIELWHAIEG